MKSKYGTEAEIIVEELLQQATCTASILLITVANKYKDDKVNLLLTSPSVWSFFPCQLVSISTDQCINPAF